MAGPGTAPRGGAILCLGVAVLDLVLDVPTLPQPEAWVRARRATLAGGGPAGTAAVAAQRLGVRAALAAVVGDDEVGSLIRAGLERDGVDVSLLQTVPGLTSPMSAGLVRPEDGTRALVTFRQPVPIEVSAELEAAARAAAWIHVDHLGFAAVAELRRRGVATPVSVDGGNPIPELDLGLVELYAPSAPELLRSSGAGSLDAALEAAVDAGPAIVVATQGEAGSTALTRIDPDAPEVGRRLGATSHDRSRAPRWRLRQPAFAVEVPANSTLGAGDVFHGALLAALAHGRPLRGALAFASAAASLACRALDGRSAIPSLAEVDALLGERREGPTAARRGP